MFERKEYQIPGTSLEGWNNFLNIGKTAMDSNPLWLRLHFLSVNDNMLEENQEEAVNLLKIITTYPIELVTPAATPMEIYANKFINTVIMN